MQGEETGKLATYIPINDWLNGEREGHEIDFSKFDKIPMEFLLHKRSDVQPYDKLLEMIDQIPAPVKLRIFNNDIPEPVFAILPFDQWIKGTNTSRHYAYELQAALTPGLDCGIGGVLCLDYADYL